MKRYPELCRWVTVTEDGQNQITVRNEMTDEEFCTDQGLPYLEFLRKLDGRTDPYSAVHYYTRQDVSVILQELAEARLIRNSRFLIRSAGSFYFTLFMPRRARSDSLLLKTTNVLLWSLFLPVFVYGIYSFWSNFSVAMSAIGTGPESILGVIAGMVLGILLHECGHLIASLSYGGRFYEMGVFLKCFLMPGAYVILKDSDSLPPIRKVQISAAGIEFNFLLAGIAFWILSRGVRYAGFFLFFASANLAMALINLLLIDGIDGCWILSWFFSLNENIVDVAWRTLFNSHKRRRLTDKGCFGKAVLCSYCLILLLQIAFPVLLLVNLIEVISWFG